MAFMSKLFKRQEPDPDQGQEAQFFSAQGSPFSFDAAAEASPTPGMSPASLTGVPNVPQQSAPGAAPQPGEAPTLEPASDQQEGQSGLMNLLQGDSPESGNPTQADESAVQEPEAGGSAAPDDLMALFEEAPEADDELQTLLAYVEDVHVQELANELRTLAEDVGIRPTRP